MTFDLPSFPSIEETEADPRPQSFRGKSIDSKQEWWIIQALLDLNFEFRYQYPLFGGYRRGGFIVDFLVMKAPNNIIVEYYGNYWHDGSRGSDDKLRERIIENSLGLSVEGIYQRDVGSQAAVRRKVRKILR